jgi:acyl carrier protein
MPSESVRSDESHIIGEISRIVTEVIGAEYLVDTEISAATTFARDLDLESVEFVALTAKLQALYGTKVDFVAFIAELELDEINDLTVGQLAGYIGRCLAAATREASREPQEAGSHG